MASVTGCAADTDEVLVRLAPEIVSSIDGTTTVHATVLAARTPAAGEDVRLEVTYTDRNGAAHAIAPIDGTTDDRGVFEAPIAGLDWDGTGTVTATVLDGGAPLMVDGAALSAAATFAVLDRTAPSVTITSPAPDTHFQQGTQVDVSVQVSDEIGVSEVWFEAAGAAERQRRTVIASGSGQSTVDFQFDINDNAQTGPTVTLYAMAGDLSGNLAAATSVTIIVDPQAP